MMDVRPGEVLLVDKPAGPTSHDVVARARKILGERKVGHTGTLDPFASGLLVLCVGAATRLAEYLSGLEKTYESTALFGERTDTLDPEGEVVERDGSWRRLDGTTVEKALAALAEVAEQVPPQFSAKKVGGEAMYRKARRGERVDLPAVPVRISHLELLDLKLPRVRFRLRCSSGTYVRAVARDLAASLGTCGRLEELRRTAIGDFRVSDAVPADRLGDLERKEGARRSPADALAHLPMLEVPTSDARRMAHGQGVETASDAVPEGVPVATLADGVLIAVAERSGTLLRPRKVFVRA